MPVYHHLETIPLDHFVLHTGTMSIVRHMDIYKGAWVRDGKTDTSMVELDPVMQETLLFDQLLSRTFKDWNSDGGHFEYFVCIFRTKSGGGEAVYFKYWGESPFWTTEQMC